MLVRTVYAEERAHLLRRLRAHARGRGLAEVFRPQGERLRYHLGTSLADLKIPFRVADAFAQVVHRATIDAYLLSAQRHRGGLAKGEYDKLILTEGFDPAALRPLSFSPPGAVTREASKRAFGDAIDAHAGIDAGLVSSFLGTDRAGRHYTRALHAILSKSIQETRANEQNEPTLWLVSLMLRSLAQKSYELSLQGPLGEPAGRFVRAAVASLLYSATALAQREAQVARAANLPFMQHTPAPQPISDEEEKTALLSCAALGILPFLGPRANVGQTGISAYGLLFDTTPKRLEDAVARLAAGEEPETLIRDIALSISQNPDDRRRAEKSAAFAAIRSNAHILATQLELLRAANIELGPQSSLGQILVGRDALEQIFASEPKRRELARAAKDAARRVGPELVKQRFEALALAASEYREEEPAGWLGAAEARHHAAYALVSLAIDTLLDRLSGQAGQLLLERSGTETEAGEQEEYESGRLYLLSPAEQPILASRTTGPKTGHLFVDVADFTRRTVFLKENVIADFLQREFYAPVLAAASGVDPGSHAPFVDPPLTLNNLLGDALSFSGELPLLMRLSRDIRAALRSYTSRLEQEASKTLIARRTQELESDHRRRRERLERSVRELLARAPFAKGAEGEEMLARAQQQKAELGRLDQAHRQELSRARGERLEAGIFISFGAVAEVARFEDPVFGPLKVAIAEKINESARGTSRNAAVRELIQARLARASKKAGRELELPFAVHIDRPPSMEMEAEHAEHLVELVHRGEEDAARRLIHRYNQSFLQQLLQPDPSRPGKLFNAGAAISQDALEAYLDERKDSLEVIRPQVEVRSLHPSLRERFFFPRPTLSLVACLHPANRALGELFVYQGMAAFKGFEGVGGIGIYEIMDPSEPFFQLLARYHLPQWGGREMTGP